MHAIGDAAVEQALNAYEAALKDYPRKDARHILIHGDLMNKEAIKKAAELGITIAVQPAFLDWPQEPEAYLESILGERAKQILPLRDMLDAGLLVTSGSDAPCTIPGSDRRHPYLLQPSESGTGPDADGSFKNLHHLAGPQRL